MGTEINKSADNAPIWMNNDFYEKALRSKENDCTITVTSSQTEGATAAGDNFSSNIYRALVRITRNGEQEERSLIIKSALPGKGKMSKRDVRAFYREVKMFTAIFPKIIHLQKNAFKQNFQQFTAKYIYSKIDKSTIAIVLEDLKQQGFKLAERTLGLDLKHCLLVMRKIAKYHAASVVMYEEDPECLNSFMTRVTDDENVRDFEPFLSSTVTNCAKEIQKWTEDNAKYAAKIHRMADNAQDYWLQGIRKIDSEFNVLSHGDLWANNMMFSYSEETGEVQDVRFVDFQLSHWTSPTVDLQYFFNSSASPELLEDLDIMVDEYYKTLAESLTLLQHQHLQPTAAQIKRQFDNRSMFGIMIAITTRAIVMVDRNEAPDMDDVIDNGQSICLSKPYIESLKKLLPIYEKKRWL